MTFYSNNRPKGTVWKPRGWMPTERPDDRPSAGNPRQPVTTAKLPRVGRVETISMQVPSLMVGGAAPRSQGLTDNLSGQADAVAIITKIEKTLSSQYFMLTPYATRLLEIYELYGFDSKGYSFKSTISHWVACIGEVVIAESSLIKFMKYKLAAFYSFHHDQPLPEKPKLGTRINDDSPGILLGGRANRFARLLRRKPEVCPLFFGALDSFVESFDASLLNAKKGMPRPTSSFVKLKERETVDSLTTEYTRRPGSTQLVDWADIDSHMEGVEISLSSRTLVVQVERTVDDLFQFRGPGSGSERMWPEYGEGVYLPSTSANYIRSRSGLGTFGEMLSSGFIDTLREWWQKQGIDASCVNVEGFLGNPTWSSDNSLAPRLRYDQGVSDEEMIGAPYDVRGWRLDGKDVLDKCFSDIWHEALIQAVAELPLVEAVGLSEALKARIISKGPPFIYFVLKLVQREMWTVLRKFKAFRLIGEPIRPEVLLETFGRRSFGKLLSGDYADATNRLDPLLSLTAANRISDRLGLPVHLKKLFQISLVGHLFLKDGKTLPQRSGQLMGSVTSFPILCIVNAACCRWALEVDSGRCIKSFDNIKLLINGDDCLLEIGERGLRSWRLITGQAGLTESIGKTYYSDKFCVMNSTHFLIRNVDGRRSFEQVNYINLGLMHGMQRSGTLDIKFHGITTGLGAKARDLVASAPPMFRRAVLKKFIKINFKSLSAVRVPWHVPECYGGWGVPGEPSLFDRKVVTAMRIGKIPFKPMPVDPALVQLDKFTKRRWLSSVNTELVTIQTELYRTPVLPNDYLKVDDVVESAELLQRYRKSLLPLRTDLEDPGYPVLKSYLYFAAFCFGNSGNLTLSADRNLKVSVRRLTRVWDDCFANKHKVDGIRPFLYLMPCKEVFTGRFFVNSNEM